MNFACMLRPWCKHAAELQLLRSQNRQPCHLSLSAWFSNTTDLLGKKKQWYERFTFLQHCKKRPNISLSPFPYKKDGLLLNDTWEKRWHMVEKCRETGSYKMVPFLGHKVQACKQNSYSRKRQDRTSGLSIPPYKMEGCWKEVVDAHGPTIL